MIIPLCKWSIRVQEGISRWIRRNIPEWTNFKVAPCAKLLGFYIGPEAGSKMWEGPLNKYENRILAIKNGQASLVLNAVTYNSRVVHVTGYVAQLIPLPNSFNERFGMLSALRCPNCMRHSEIFEIHKFGGPKLRSISVSCTAALTRTAFKTVTTWQSWAKQL